MFVCWLLDFVLTNINFVSCSVVHMIDYFFIQIVRSCLNSIFQVTILDIVIVIVIDIVIDIVIHCFVNFTDEIHFHFNKALILIIL